MQNKVQSSDFQTFSFEDRTVELVKISADSSLPDIHSEPGAHRASLFLILSGSLRAEATELEPGAWYCSSAPAALGGKNGCLAVHLQWQTTHSIRTEWGPPATGPWFEEYSAFVHAIKFKQLTSFDPWTCYWIEVPGGVDRPSLHVHNRLTNLIAIAESKPSAPGYLIAEADLFRAWPLIQGDFVIVDPETSHNLIGNPTGPPMKFFVLNNSPSNYQTPDESDFHVRNSTLFRDLVVTDHLRDLPRLFRVVAGPPK